MGIAGSTSAHFTTGKHQAGSGAYNKWKQYLSDMAAGKTLARHHVPAGAGRVEETPEEAKERKGADALRAKIEGKRSQ